MSKRLLFLLVSSLLLAGIVACQSTTQAVQVTVAPPAETTATRIPIQATVTPLPTATSTVAPTLTPTTTQQNPESPKTKMVIPPTIEPTPPFEWQIPSIGEGEWVEGSDAAGMTLIEYGDYQ